MKQYCFDVAREVRLQSDCSTKVGAVLERGGRILSVACNKSGSMANGGYLYSRHAEGSLLNNRDACGATVYVFRAHARTGQTLLARPCHRCESRLREANVKRVFYTTEDGWEEMRLT